MCPADNADDVDSRRGARNFPAKPGNFWKRVYRAHRVIWFFGVHRPGRQTNRLEARFFVARFSGESTRREPASSLRVSLQWRHNLRSYSAIFGLWLPAASTVSELLPLPGNHARNWKQKERRTGWKEKFVQTLHLRFDGNIYREFAAKLILILDFKVKISFFFGIVFYLSRGKTFPRNLIVLGKMAKKFLDHLTLRTRNINYVIFIFRIISTVSFTINIHV